MARMIIAFTACALTAALSPFPLQGVVDQAREYAAASPLLTPTPFNRSSYLPVIHGIVTFWRQYQVANGSIVDPYAQIEIQYATPTYAWAGAVLITSGYDTSLLNTTALAVDSALSSLSRGYAPQGHTNFFIFPLIHCYMVLKSLVEPSRAAQWETWLRAIQPEGTYKTGGNWGLVAVGGEFIRTTVLGLGDPTWWQTVFTTQIEEGEFTPNGQYQDHSGMAGLNPIPYDTFPDKYLTVMLAEGYNATNYPFSSDLWTLMSRAGWTHLLMQSPWGEIPTGGRSSQHTWNEAATAATFEIQSNWARQAGDAQAACMFKRAAHLALGSVARWQNPDGSLQIVKNRFNASVRWGFEEYSFFSQYNLLPASQLATAYYFSDASDSVAECATFADVGGFVFELPEFNVVIANSRGTYLELETGSDPHYDSTGLTRMHVNTCGTLAAGECHVLNPLIGPSAGPPQENGGLTTGVFWATAADAPGVTHRLGNWTYVDVTDASMTAYFNNTPDSVMFNMEYVALEMGIVVREAYTLTNGQASVTASMAADFPGDKLVRFGITFPSFLFDGATNTSTFVPSGAFTSSASNATVSAVGAAWGQQVFATGAAPDGHNITWTYDPSASIVTRNGLAAPIYVEVAPISTNSPSISYTLGPALQPV